MTYDYLLGMLENMTTETVDRKLFMSAGHVYERHVGRTDQELLSRILFEGKTDAGTFIGFHDGYDTLTPADNMRESVLQAVFENSREIAGWYDSDFKMDFNKNIHDYSLITVRSAVSDMDNPIGRVLHFDRKQGIIEELFSGTAECVFERDGDRICLATAYPAVGTGAPVLRGRVTRLEDMENYALLSTIQKMKFLELQGLKGDPRNRVGSLATKTGHEMLVVFHEGWEILGQY